MRKTNAALLFLAMFLYPSELPITERVEPIKKQEHTQKHNHQDNWPGLEDTISVFKDYNKDSEEMLERQMIEEYIKYCDREGYPTTERKKMYETQEILNDSILTKYHREGLDKAEEMILRIKAKVQEEGCDGYGMGDSLPLKERWELSVREAKRLCDRDINCHDLGKYLSDGELQGQTEDYQNELIKKYCSDKGYLFNEVIVETVSVEEIPFCVKMFSFFPDRFSELIDFDEEGTLLGLAYETAGIMSYEAAFGNQDLSNLFANAKETICKKQNNIEDSISQLDAMSMIIFSNRVVHGEAEYKTGNFSIGLGDIFPGGVARVKASKRDRALTYRGKTLLEYINDCR